MDGDIVHRIYPLRTTRKYWKIPLLCKHECNSLCRHVLTRDEFNPDLYHIIENKELKDGKCERDGSLQHTGVHISSFNVMSPSGIAGPLCYANTIVIPDIHFKVLVTYPFCNPLEVTVRSPTSIGFTLKELLHALKSLYEFIYFEEERTSTPTVYHLKKFCDGCLGINLMDMVQKISTEEGECSICYSTFWSKDKIGKLQCGHKYHIKCIGDWLKHGNNCPLCRQYLFSCPECRGSGFIYYDYTGTVIPLEHRGLYRNRNMTNGVFGIYGHDLSDLFIQLLTYNRTEKRLVISVGS